MYYKQGLGVNAFPLPCLPVERCIGFDVASRPLKGVAPRERQFWASGKPYTSMLNPYRLSPQAETV